MRHQSHGLGNRGLEAGANPGLGHGRFGRMFGRPAHPTNLPREALEAIAGAMTFDSDNGKGIRVKEPLDENHTIPAGYTYFGQFIDHDITFDPTPLTDKTNDVAALEDFRTPALDLDSVYASGPDAQPYLYDGLRLRVGPSPGNGNAITGTKNDLYRLPEKDGFIALIGDKRNDENKIVSQLHGVFIAFHNRMVEGHDDLLEIVVPFLRHMGDEFQRGEALKNEVIRFRAAAAVVRWHYQWLILHDFLPRVLYPGVLDQVLNRRGTMPVLPHYLHANPRYAYMPVEFAAAAYRFGHSMVRPSYSLNSVVTTLRSDPDGKTRIPIFVPNQPRAGDAAAFLDSLNGFPGPLPQMWGIDWGYFFKGVEARVPPPQEEKNPFQVPQPSYRLDANLVHPLTALPEFEKAHPEIFKNLAFRNLQRGQMLELPSGEAVAGFLGLPKSLRVPEAKLWTAGSRLADTAPPEEKEDKDSLAERQEHRHEVVRSFGADLKEGTPLWYYVLREAEYFGVLRDPSDPLIAAGGQHLGPVGSRIVAETFVGLLWMDSGSFLHRMPGFRPFREIDVGEGPFTLSKLIRFALPGEA